MLRSMPSSPSSSTRSQRYINNKDDSREKNNNISSPRNLQNLNSSNVAQTSQLCRLDCGKEWDSPVCGMDNITYRSRCDLHQTVCRGTQVEFQYRGECSQCKCML